VHVAPRHPTARTRLPGVATLALTLEDYLAFLGGAIAAVRPKISLAKYLGPVRGLLENTPGAVVAADRHLLDGFSLQHTLRRTVTEGLNSTKSERLVQALPAP